MTHWKLGKQKARRRGRVQITGAPSAPANSLPMVKPSRDLASQVSMRPIPQSIIEHARHDLTGRDAHTRNRRLQRDCQVSNQGLGFRTNNHCDLRFTPDGGF